MADDDQLSIYDEVEIEDMTYDAALELYHYPCPCGDRFEIALADLRDAEDIAVCPSCSLMIRVIFEVDSLPKPPGKEDEGGGKGVEKMEKMEKMEAQLEAEVAA